MTKIEDGFANFTNYSKNNKKNKFQKPDYWSKTHPVHGRRVVLFPHILAAAYPPRPHRSPTLLYSYDTLIFCNFSPTVALSILKVHESAVESDIPVEANRRKTTEGSMYMVFLILSLTDCDFDVEKLATICPRYQMPNRFSETIRAQRTPLNSCCYTMGTRTVGLTLEEYVILPGGCGWS